VIHIFKTEFARDRLWNQPPQIKTLRPKNYFEIRISLHRLAELLLAIEFDVV
jgi:hypothetical protein